jgi:hypothetical protein
LSRWKKNQPGINIFNLTRKIHQMKKYSLFLILMLFPIILYCQNKTEFNFGFEKNSAKGKLPDNCQANDKVSYFYLTCINRYTDNLF